MSDRHCTCHPDDNPPVPCPKRYALSECKAAPAPDASTVDQIMALARQYAWPKHDGEQDAAEAALRAAVKQLEQRALLAEHGHTVAKSACLALGSRWDETISRANKAEAERDALKGLLAEFRDAEQCLGVNDTLINRVNAVLGDSR